MEGQAEAIRLRYVPPSSSLRYLSATSRAPSAVSNASAKPRLLSADLKATKSGAKLAANAGATEAITFFLPASNFFTAAISFTTSLALKLQTPVQ